MLVLVPCLCPLAELLSTDHVLTLTDFTPRQLIKKSHVIHWSVTRWNHVFFIVLIWPCRPGPLGASLHSLHSLPGEDPGPTWGVSLSVSVSVSLSSCGGEASHAAQHPGELATIVGFVHAAAKHPCADVDGKKA